MREPRAPVGPRAAERMAQRAELANMTPGERVIHRKAQREARMAERANMAKLSPEERKANRLNARIEGEGTLSSPPNSHGVR